MTPFQQILQITLRNTQKLLVDSRIGVDTTALDYNDAPYQVSQFKTIYDTEAYVDGNTRSPYKDQQVGNDPTYPLTHQEALDLQDLRILEFIQLGFIPIEDLTEENLDDKVLPSLYIENATDRHRISPGDTTLQQVQEAIPLNFRLMTKQPEDYVLEKTNLVVVDKILEGLKYVLNEDDYINLSFPRRGYDSPTVIRNINFIRALNVEGWATPYEMVDFLFQITIREQRSRSNR